MTIRERDRQPCAAMPAIPRHDRHPPTSQRMPRVGDFHFCWKPVGVVLQCVTDFKDYFGLDQCQARLYTAIRRHLVLVMAALTVCAVTAAQLKNRTRAPAPPPPARPDEPPPRDPGLIPLTVHEVKRLLAAALTQPDPPGHAARWLEWRRRHQARSRWFHQRAHLARNYPLVS